MAANDEDPPKTHDKNDEGILLAKAKSRRKKVRAKRKLKIEDRYSLTERVVGRGTFGTVYQATCKRTGKKVAVKKVKLDLRYRNRELQMIAMVRHQNVVKLVETFSRYDDLNNFWIHIVMEYMHKNMYEAIRGYKRQRRHIPLHMAKLWSYQICRGVAYIHRLGIVHRDLKPQNILVNTSTGEVKLCDFGSAKIPAEGEQSVSYIGSRYYRAPELIFESTEYRQGIDVWATGCVIAEMLLSEPIFVGNHNDELLENITDVLGRPTRKEVFHMNPQWCKQGKKWKTYQLSETEIQTDFLRQQFGREQYVTNHGLSQDDQQTIPESFVQLLREFFQYNPAERCTCFDVLTHSWFDELREADFNIPDLKQLPALFNWTDGELREANEFDIWDDLQRKQPQQDVESNRKSSAPQVIASNAETDLTNASGTRAATGASTDIEEGKADNAGGVGDRQANS